MNVEDGFKHMLQEASEKGLIDTLLTLKSVEGKPDCFAGAGGDYPVLGVYG